MRTQLRLEEGWSTLFILWAMLFVSSYAMTQADLIDGLHVIPLVATTAVFTGLLLAKSRFSPSTAHLFSFVYGLFLVFWLVSSLNVYFPEEMTARARTIDLIERQFAWLRKAFGGGTSRDGLIFVIQTSAIFWLLGYSAAWFTFRVPRVWRAIVPTGLVLLSVVYYYSGPNLLWVYLIIYLLLSLMFVVRTHLVFQERYWRAAGVRYEPGVWWSFLRAGFVAAVALMLVAWNLPTLSASTAVNDALTGTRGPWREFQDTWTRLFSALRSYGGPTADPYQDTLVLGGPRTVGDVPVMDVLVPEKLANVYWQAIVYDTYEDGRWDVAASDETVLVYPDEGVLTTPFAQARQVVTQTVINYLPNSSLLYGAPEIIGTNRQMFVEGTTDSSGNMLVTTVRSRYVLRQGDRYEVTSRVPVADAQSLRQAGTAYPDWVMERYLQLPDTISEDTLALAADLIRPHDNPYDAAVAVRDYLRENIAYNDQIDAPPEGIDPVHYTLFISKEGYCNYYASAMAVMLRSQGIPARIVSGYAQGTFDPEGRLYRVLASNAHTWVEVYFPGYGWIQFEPTASIPVESRPETAATDVGDAFNNPAFSPDNELDREALLGEEEQQDPALDALPDLPTEDAAADTAVSTFPIWQVVLAVLGLAVTGGLLFAANEMNRRVEQDVERSYSRLGSWARWLGIFFRPAQTPYERADLMVTAVPEGKEPIRHLVQAYVKRQFSPTKDEDGVSPMVEWQQLRPLLIKKAIQKRLENLRRKPKETDAAARWQRMQNRRP